MAGMNDKSGPKERLPSNFPDPSDWRRQALEQELEKRASSPLPEELATLIEQAIKAPAAGSIHGKPSGAGAAERALEKLPERLIEELSAAQKRLAGEPPLAPPEEEEEENEDFPPPASKTASLAGLRRRAGTGALAAAGLLRRAFRLRDWRCRYLALLSFIHRRIFDRRIERLLFIKTSGPSPTVETEADGWKAFCYHGPIPSMVFNWALSALPANLKHYAFVDFRAGNGRTLLLASRRNFEHATGYAPDTESCAVLEMNLAQYSRSYMSCRDVRALRGDRDGMSIPLQPAVLFFPNDLGASHLPIVLSHLAASMRLNPRPVYLIFENSGPEQELEQMLLFRRVSLPLVNRLKARLFSPANVAVYKSLNSGAID